MEKVTTENPVQEAEENEVEVNEVTASPPSLIHYVPSNSRIGFSM